MKQRTITRKELASGAMEAIRDEKWLDLIPILRLIDN